MQAEAGGAFTDLVAVDPDRVIGAKVPSTPHSPDIGAYAAPGAGGIAATTVTAVPDKVAAPVSDTTTVVISLKSKDKAVLHKGDIVTLSVGGGGGYGPPSGRHPAARERDRLEGYVTA